MRFQETSKNFFLNKNTYLNLRWIAFIGQLSAILFVLLILKFKFNYSECLFVVFLGVLTNIYLKFRIKENQLDNLTSTIYLAYDILQLGVLLFFTGGITNPFILLLIIPAVFSSQYLNIGSSIILVTLTITILFIITFFYFELPHPEVLHFHAPNYYLYSIPVSIFIGLVFLVYFGVKFGSESRKRQEAYDRIKEIMAKENELVSLGGQAAAAAHSLGTPLSTILLTSKELLKDNENNEKIKNDLELLLSQSSRCSEILKKLTLNPTVEDEFLDTQISFKEYIDEIVRSYEKISNKKFIVNLKQFNNPLKTYKSVEVLYGLRNFIGNANKFSKSKVEIFLKSEKKTTEIIIKDDGPGFPKDLIDKHKLGEPYIRSADKSNIAKYGLGLGTFIGKTLLEKNYAKIFFENSKEEGEAQVIIKWNNKDLKNII